MDCSASAQPAASQRTAGTGSGPACFTSVLSEGAGTYAVATQGRSASGSASMTAAVNTPLTRLAAATSRANLARKPASSASSILIVFTATRRPGRGPGEEHLPHRPGAEPPDDRVRADPFGVPAAQRLHDRLRHRRPALLQAIASPQ